MARTHLLSRVHSLGRDDDLLGGKCAVIATILVLRDSFGRAWPPRSAGWRLPLWVSLSAWSTWPSCPPRLGAGGAGRRQRPCGHAAGPACKSRGLCRLDLFSLPRQYQDRL